MMPSDASSGGVFYYTRIRRELDYSIDQVAVLDGIVFTESSEVPMMRWK